MTWKEFKDWMGARGVKDGDMIDWIDIHAFELNHFMGEVRKESQGWQVYS